MKSLLKKIVPSFFVSWYHFFLAFAGALFFGFPSKKMKVIGVTGTNGKTTTVNLISCVLEEAGFNVAFISSVRFKILDKERENVSRMTMPGRFQIQKFIKSALDSKVQYVILEVSSEGIKQFRHKFIDFNTAVFTNLAPEHIEAHGGFNNYKEAKGEFFKSVRKIHIVNAEDDYADYFLSFQAEKKYTYGLKTGDVNFESSPFNFSLPGVFNRYNALAALCVGLSEGIDLKIGIRAVEKARGIPGRMEEVISFPFKVFVDYGFTPNALEKVYKTLIPKEGKMIAVFGSCGGGRDKWKRPILGEIAGKYCHKIILTNEDPFDENPMEIINQVAKRIEGKAEKILDRRKAIRRSLECAEKGDVVVITGKGCEKSICFEKGKRVPWDDRTVAEEEFLKLKLDKTPQEY